MAKNVVVKSSQEQAVAAWIGYLRVLRIETLLDKLAAQDCNLEMAMKALSEVKDFISNPTHILGSTLTKHGEVAEHMQVGFSNAEAAICGQPQSHTFEGVGRLAMEDYLCNGKMIQSKFYNGVKGTFQAIIDHSRDYPTFMNEGGKYDIPRDQYARLMDIYERGENARSSLMRSEETLFKAMKEWEVTNSVQIRDVIKPAVVGYDEVQLGVADRTIAREEQHIKEIDEDIRKQAYNAAKPKLKEGAKVTAVSAILEGSVTFGIKVIQKRKAGTKLQNFTREDWKEVGFDTLVGTGKGAIRGTVVYVTSNYTPIPSAFASGMVTTTFGVIAQARKLNSGMITAEDFIGNSEAICLDMAISVICSTCGGVLIPIPVLGAIIGNAVGMLMYEISKNFLSGAEQKMISGYRNECEEFTAKLQSEHQLLVKKLNEEVKQFTANLVLILDNTGNQQFEGSIALARGVGADESKIIKNRAERDAFFVCE